MFKYVILSMVLGLTWLMPMASAAENCPRVIGYVADQNRGEPELWMMSGGKLYTGLEGAPESIPLESPRKGERVVGMTMQNLSYLQFNLLTMNGTKVFRREIMSRDLDPSATEPVGLGSELSLRPLERVIGALEFYFGGHPRIFVANGPNLSMIATDSELRPTGDRILIENSVELEEGETITGLGVTRGRGTGDIQYFVLSQKDPWLKLTRIQWDLTQNRVWVDSNFTQRIRIPEIKN